MTFSTCILSPRSSFFLMSSYATHKDCLHIVIDTSCIYTASVLVWRHMFVASYNMRMVVAMLLPYTQHGMGWKRMRMYIGCAIHSRTALFRGRIAVNSPCRCSAVTGAFSGSVRLLACASLSVVQAVALPLLGKNADMLLADGSLAFWGV